MNDKERAQEEAKKLVIELQQEKQDRQRDQDNKLKSLLRRKLLQARDVDAQVEIMFEICQYIKEN